MEERQATSVFVLLTTIGGPYCGALYEVKIQQGGEILGEEVKDDPKLLDPVFNFFDDGLAAPLVHSLVGARFNSPSDLYVFIPYARRDPPSCLADLAGYVFHTEDGSLESLEPHKACKRFGNVIAAYGKLYFLAGPGPYTWVPKPSFECYDPFSKSWESLPRFPPYTNEWAYMSITGYAVCYGCILVSLSAFGKFHCMVFQIASKTWHKVKCEGGDRCNYYPFRGRAVVVDDTIYALSDHFGEVIAFCLSMDPKYEGHIICSLGKPLLLPGLKSECKGDDEYHMGTEYLVHLGNRNFCLVQTITEEIRLASQYLWITTFKIVNEKGGAGKHIKTLHSTVRDMMVSESVACGSLFISFSFTPDWEDFEPKEETLATMKQRKRENEEETRGKGDSTNEEETKGKETTLDEHSMLGGINALELALKKIIVDKQLTVGMNKAVARQVIKKKVMAEKKQRKRKPKF